MIDITIQFEVDDRPVEVDEITDEYLAEVLEHTGEQIRRHVAKQLGDMRCKKHGNPPQVTVTGVYTSDTDQMELDYHVDSCCEQVVLQAVQALAH